MQALLNRLSAVKEGCPDGECDLVMVLRAPTSGAYPARTASLVSLLVDALPSVNLAVDRRSHSGVDYLLLKAKPEAVREHALASRLPLRMGPQVYQRADELDQSLSASIWDRVSSADRARITAELVESVRVPPEAAAGLDGLDPADVEASVLFLLRSSLPAAVGTFCPHNERERVATRSLWISFPSRQDIDAMRDYAGETVAFYFAFLAWYQGWLVYPAAAGLLVYFLEDDDVFGTPYSATFAFFVAVWATVMLETWRRREAVLADRWHSGELDLQERPRPEYAAPRTPPAPPGAGGDALRDARFPELPALVRARRHEARLRQVRMLATVPATLLALLASFAVLLLFEDLNDFVQAFLGGASDAPAAPARRRHGWRGHASSVAGRLLVGVVGLGRDAADLSPWARSLLQYAPAVAFALALPTLNAAFTWLACKLTVLENHRTASGHSFALALRLALFHLSNNFAPLIFLAFIRQDAEALRERLFALMTTQLVVGNLKELGIPLAASLANNVMRAVSARGAGTKARKAAAAAASSAGAAPVPPDPADTKPPPAAADTAAAETAAATAAAPAAPAAPAAGRPAEASAAAPGGRSLVAAVRRGVHVAAQPWYARQDALSPYDDAFLDLIEIVTQFGHSALFAAVFPLAPLYAWLNNVAEARVDAWKVCEVFQRPAPRAAAGLGTWDAVLVGVAYAAVTSNCALLALHSDAFREATPSLTPTARLLAAVAVEHALLAANAFVAWAIDDLPLELRLRRSLEARRAADDARRRRVVGILRSAARAGVASIRRARGRAPQQQQPQQPQPQQPQPQQQQPPQPQQPKAAAPTASPGMRMSAVAESAAPLLASIRRERPGPQAPTWAKLRTQLAASAAFRDSPTLRRDALALHACVDRLRDQVAELEDQRARLKRRLLPLQQ